ncbi:MAG: NADH-quinone oxidoreductase subunit J [Chloroflexi bacterium]|nr:NADH-quinone oxidoreductase subunit J [Chloroflexota bacterium]
MEAALFWPLALVAIVAAVAVIAARNAVYSALFMVVVLFCLALLYLSLGAEFLAAVQIIIYAGAIMVLFLFVITLLNPQALPEQEHLPGQRWLGLPLLGLLVLALVAVVASAAWRPLPPSTLPANNIVAVGQAIFRSYLFPFEITSLLLLVAIVGAVVLAQRRA